MQLYERTSVDLKLNRTCTGDGQRAGSQKKVTDG